MPRFDGTLVPGPIGSPWGVVNRALQVLIVKSASVICTKGRSLANGAFIVLLVRQLGTAIQAHVTGPARRLPPRSRIELAIIQSGRIGPIYWIISRVGVQIVAARDPDWVLRKPPAQRRIIV